MTPLQRVITVYSDMSAVASAFFLGGLPGFKAEFTLQPHSSSRARDSRWHVVGDGSRSRSRSVSARHVGPTVRVGRPSGRCHIVPMLVGGNGPLDLIMTALVGLGQLKQDQ